MARNKRPALTSPWKIGFLVSLLLVAVSIGVGYLMTRSFGLTWSWIEFHGTWTDFTFHQDAFMTQMLPLAVLVPVVSLVAFLMISGAVRKYRRYLESGQDHKRLTQAISKIEDLSDESAIRKVSHPELKKFLLNLRSGMVEREKELDAREAALAGDQDGTPASPELATEATALAAAIASNFDDPLSLTVPELKQIERAARDHLAGGASDDAGERLSEMRDDLTRLAEALRGRLDEIRTELAQSEQGARELESEVASLRTHASAAGPAPDTGQGAERAISRLDSISEVLNTLGEETRSVAIKTALQASSPEASVDSVVRLADEVRDVAAKFNGVASEWHEASESARQAIGSASGSGESPHTVESLDALANKVSMWAEQAVIVAEKVRTFEEHFTDALAGATATEAGSSPASPASEPETGDWGLETNRAAPSVDTPQAEAAGGDFETTDKPAVLDESAEAKPPGKSGADASVFEKQNNLFSEVTGAGDNAEMFTDIPDPTPASPEATMVDCTTVELEPAAPATGEPAPTPGAVDEPAPAADATGDDEMPNRQTEYVIDDAPAPEVFVDDDAGETAGSSADDDGMITGPQFGTDETPSIPSPPPEIELEPEASQDEDDAIDLYALGAEDYEPENVHHNA